MPQRLGQRPVLDRAGCSNVGHEQRLRDKLPLPPSHFACGPYTVAQMRPSPGVGLYHAECSSLSCAVVDILVVEQAWVPARVEVVCHWQQGLDWQCLDHELVLLCFRRLSLGNLGLTAATLPASISNLTALT